MYPFLLSIFYKFSADTILVSEKNTFAIIHHSETCLIIATTLHHLELGALTCLYYKGVQLSETYI